MECRVVGLKEGTPSIERDLKVWRHFESDLSLRVIELDGDAALFDEDDDETLYVLEGSGTANGTPVSRDTAIGNPATYALELAGKMTLVSSLTPRGTASQTVQIVHLENQPRQKTADRWYVELIQGETTQFVGAIPPGRAPDHFHLYEEVLCILSGTGVMWAGEESWPIGPGSCVFLPRRQVHCVENTGTAELRLLGVFHPAGSPAVRYPA